MANIFSLYIPFFLSPGREIELQDIYNFEILKKHEAQLKKNKHFYSILISGFQNTDEAKEFFPETLGSLYWHSLKEKVGIKFNSNLAEPTIFDPPLSRNDEGIFKSLLESNNWSNLHGIYDADKPTIIPNNQNFTTITSYPATITIGLNPNNLSENLDYCLNEFENPSLIINNKKLKLAFELYSQSFYEISSEAKLITLVTILEVLSPNEDVSEFTKTIIDKFKETLNNKLKSLQPDSDEFKECNSVIGRLKDFHEKSITQKIKNHIVRLSIPEEQENTPSFTSQKVNKFYKIRSQLVHGEQPDQEELEEALRYLENLIPRLLEKAFKICTQHPE
jgi:hypothetical protein